MIFLCLAVYFNKNLFPSVDPNAEDGEGEGEAADGQAAEEEPA